jgi:transcriptional regulator with XRE-family HTH domain
MAVGLESVSHVAHWERGRKLPSLKNALKLSAIIQCPVEVLFFDLFDSLRDEVRERADNLSTKTKTI